jgi:hypothetical protein
MSWLRYLEPSTDNWLGCLMCWLVMAALMAAAYGALSLIALLADAMNVQ